MVSIIVATYNGAKYIKNTIESALMQKNIKIEVIVIDDCSTDDTYKMVVDISRFDKRIQVYKNKKNLGFCKSINVGVQLSRGEYIVILDQDDILQNDHCYNAVKYFDSSTVLVFNDYYLIDSKGKTFDKDDHCFHRNIEQRDLMLGNVIPAPGLMIKKREFEKIGKYAEFKNFPNYGEYYAWIKLSNLGKIAFCKENITLYRRHESNMTNDFNNVNKKRVLYKYFILCKKTLQKENKLNTKDKIALFINIQYDYIKLFVITLFCIGENAKNKIQSVGHVL